MPGAPGSQGPQGPKVCSYGDRVACLDPASEVTQKGRGRGEERNKAEGGGASLSLVATLIPPMTRFDR